MSCDVFFALSRLFFSDLDNGITPGGPYQLTGAVRLSGRKIGAVIEGLTLVTGATLSPTITTLSRTSSARSAAFQLPVDQSARQWLP